MIKLYEVIEPVSIKKLIQFLAMPTIVGILTAWLWWTIRAITQDNNMRTDSPIIIGGSLKDIFYLYAIVAGLSISHASQKLINMWKEVYRKDFEKFKESTYSIHSGPAKFFMVVLSLPILCGYFMYPYASTLVGLFTIFWVPFVLTFTYKLAEDLDDPFDGLFRINGIPEKWINELINENYERVVL